ncbi:alcohol dehydrogenase [Silvimonas iriomotensis]|uniref:Alcohol dehydrogenase n=2 Tax=Silvimonas iriomotensis TaxID=449662 RepID=A0ABQ2P7M2_9NEIS|nr:alcohol dehydrogenase [Silvimonas iriomotensis]
MAGFGREQLQLVDVPVPQPGPHEVLVKVAAVSVNFRDHLTVENGMGAALAFPFVPGSDMAGTVAQVGPGVKRVAPGQRVINTFWTNWHDTPLPKSSTQGKAFGGPVLPGVFSQYLVFNEEDLIPAPETLDDSAASTLTCAGLTAWNALISSGHLQAGQRVLIQGSGGVALFAAQIALGHGAQVILTSASADKRARAKALGVQHVIDRTQPDWPDAVLAATGGHGVDHVIELAGGDLTATLSTLATGGRIAIIGVLDGFHLNVPTPLMFARRARIEGIGVGNRKSLRELAQWLDLNNIKPVIEAEYALADLPAALSHQQRGPFGKVVVRMN